MQKEHEVILAMPFVGHEEDFRKMGIECIPVSMNRRGVNPLPRQSCCGTISGFCKKSARTLLHIPLNQISIWVCSAVAKRFPYYANVQGLGTAFQKPVLAGFVTVLYRIAFRKVKYVFFENKEKRPRIQRKKHRIGRSSGCPSRCGN